jgi:hypothetical protein
MVVRVIMVMVMVVPVIFINPMATPLLGMMLMVMPRYGHVHMPPPLPILSMAAAVRLLALSTGGPIGRAILRFRMFPFEMVNVTHSGFLGRFVV